MKKHLIISDLDGTLADVDHYVNDTTKHFIRKLLDDGHLFYIATGRMKALVEDVAKGIDHRIRVIGSNGGIIQTPNGFEITSIDLKEKKALYEYVTEKKIPTLFFTDKDVLYTDFIPEFFDIPTEYGNVVKKIEDVKKDVYDKEIVNILLMGHHLENPQAVLEPARKDIKANIDLTVTSSNIFNLEVYSKKASKGNALKKILEIHDLTADDVIAFGDGFNDVSMFQVAKTSVAMENAPQKVKDNASHSTLTNGENGVVKFLKKHL